ncbi:MAG: ribbon-helix-helix protein, CopG family [Actinomycetia bacterium]|nr:ribbon-helix-helix protein, CopG family [Actinomycetes bacterium]
MAMTLRTDDELDAALTALAEAEGLSRQEVVRRAVLDRLAHLEHQIAVESSGHSQAEKWQSLIDRLGSV